jgi:hypothetical protein
MRGLRSRRSRQLRKRRDAPSKPIFAMGFLTGHRIAWKSMPATNEGMEKGEKWCKRAI